MTIRWYLGGIALAAAIGWVAAKCHLGGWAPVGLVSLGIGVLLGLAISKLAAATGVAGRKLLAGTVLFALVTVLAAHTWLYVDFRRQWVEARASAPQVAMFRPEEPWSPAAYFQHEISSGRLTLWCVDALFIAIGAGGVVLVKRGADANKFVVADDANNPDP